MTGIGTDAAARDLAHATQAYTEAYLRLEGSIPGFSLAEVDGLRLVHFGRPKAGADHEVIAGTTAPETVLDIVARHPDVADAFISTFTTSEERDEERYREAGYMRVVRNFLMRCHVSMSRTARADDTVVRLATTAQIEQLADLRDDGQILPEYLADPALRCYALVIDDTPSASAMLVADGGDTAVVEYVNTLERYRRRGYGRWLMRMLHREAAQLGAQSVVLSSNATGRPLYEALGYEFLCYEDVYRR